MKLFDKIKGLFLPSPSYFDDQRALLSIVNQALNQKICENYERLRQIEKERKIIEKEIEDFLLENHPYKGLFQLVEIESIDYYTQNEMLVWYRLVLKPQYRNNFIRSGRRR